MTHAGTHRIVAAHREVPAAASHKHHRLISMHFMSLVPMYSFAQLDTTKKYAHSTMPDEQAAPHNTPRQETSHPGGGRYPARSKHFEEYSQNARCLLLLSSDRL